jgi:hypothetical protein
MSINTRDVRLPMIIYFYLTGKKSDEDGHAAERVFQVSNTYLVEESACCRWFDRIGRMPSRTCKRGINVSVWWRSAAAELGIPSDPVSTAVVTTEERSGTVCARACLPWSRVIRELLGYTEKRCWWMDGLIARSVRQPAGGCRLSAPWIVP